MWSQHAWAAGQWDTLFLSLFAHAGLLHLLTNLVALASFGPAVERQIGHARFAALYLAAGVAGNLAQASYGAVPVVGASGALFGLFGLLMLLAPRGAVRVLFVIPCPILLAGAAYVAAIPLLQTMSSALPIAHFAHLGGMVAGMVAAALLSARRAAYVAPAAAVVFGVAWVGIAWAAKLDVARLLRTTQPAPLFDQLWPLLAMAAILLPTFAYLRWVDERVPWTAPHAIGVEA
jgi:membrane associated rhomboid family serine protease